MLLDGSLHFAHSVIIPCGESTASPQEGSCALLRVATGVIGECILHDRVNRPPLPPRKLVSQIARLRAPYRELGGGHAINIAH